MARNYNTVAVDVNDWVQQTKARMMAVVKGSLQDAVNQTQEPVGKGGRMRVLTGFLRASGRASLNGWPSGPNIRPKDAQPGQFSWDGEAVTAVLIKMKEGDTFHFGWTAAYAATREVYDGFLETTMQDWQQIVNRNVQRVTKTSYANAVTKLQGPVA